MPCPKDAPWSDRFDEAMQPAVLGDWSTAVERMAALAGDVPDSPIIWRNLAILRGWIGDNAGCGEALRRYAAIRVERRRRPGRRRRSRSQGHVSLRRSARRPPRSLQSHLDGLRRRPSAGVAPVVAAMARGSVRSGAIQRRRESAAEGRLHDARSTHARRRPKESRWRPCRGFSVMPCCSGGKPTAKPGSK